MGSAYANGFPFIAEILRVPILGTTASKGDIFLVWRGESWLDECLEFGPSTGHSQRAKAFATRGQRSCCLKVSVSGGEGDMGCTSTLIVPWPHYNREKPRDNSVSAANMCWALSSVDLTAFSHATFSGLLFPLTFSFNILVSPRSVEMSY
jgi:hypothetical protein